MKKVCRYILLKKTLLLLLLTNINFAFASQKYATREQKKKIDSVWPKMFCDECIYKYSGTAEEFYKIRDGICDMEWSKRYNFYLDFEAHFDMIKSLAKVCLQPDEYSNP